MPCELLDMRLNERVTPVLLVRYIGTSEWSLWTWLHLDGDVARRKYHARTLEEKSAAPETFEVYSFDIAYDTDPMRSWIEYHTAIKAALWHRRDQGALLSQWCLQTGRPVPLGTLDFFLPDPEDPEASDEEDEDDDNFSDDESDEDED